MAEDDTPSRREIAVPAAQRPQRMERIDRELDLEPGQYWRLLEPVTSGPETVYEAGTVLLVKRLRYVDDILHKVEMARHPAAEKRWDLEFLTDEFFEKFERCFDGPEIRAREIAELQGRITGIQASIAEGVGEARQIAGPGKAPTVNALIARAEQADAVKSVIASRVDEAETAADLIKVKVEEMTEATQVLGRYMNEQAEAALAAVSETIEHAESLQRGVKTLGLFTGEGVDVAQLCDGEPAPAHEKLHLYQRKLFMDEEWLIQLSNGGADRHDFEDFGAALEANPDLLRRILPQPRSVVLMAYRRAAKRYVGDDIRDPRANAFVNAMLNHGNMDAFLLVRNGDRVFQVFSELSTRVAGRLFPTEKEVEDIYKKHGRFRGEDAESLKLSDLQYSDARARHDAIGLFYRRLLILLWGLDQRERLFGEFYDRTNAPSWLSLDFQMENFRFVHDDEGALTVARPRFHQWVREKNALMTSGSRVLCIWKNFVCEENAPGAFRAGRYHESSDVSKMNYAPRNETDTVVVTERDGHFYASMPSAYCGWQSESKIKRLEKDIEVRLDEVRISDSMGFLCLDGVTSEELDYYLNSRREREGYLTYIPLFAAARDQLRDEEAEAAPFMSAMRDGLIASGASGTDDEFNEAITESVRLWRALNGAKSVPKPGDDAFAKAQQQVGQVAFTILGNGHDYSSLVADEMAALGRVPLRLAISGKGQLVVYATVTEAEQLPWDLPEAWVMRAIASVTKTGRLKLGSFARERLKEKRGDEYVLRDWQDAKEWIDRPLPFKLAKPAYVEQFMARMEVGELQGQLVSADEFTADELDHWLEVFDEGVTISGRSVMLPGMFLPMGVASYWRHRRDMENGDLCTYHVTYGFEIDLAEMIHARGGKEVIEKWMRHTYAKPEPNIRRLGEHPCGLLLSSAATRYATNPRRLNANGLFTYKSGGIDTRRMPLDGIGDASDLNEFVIDALRDSYAYGLFGPRSRENEEKAGAVHVHYQAPWAEDALDRFRQIAAPGNTCDSRPK